MQLAKRGLYIPFLAVILILFPTIVQLSHTSPPTSPIADSVVASAPVLGGWGGTRLTDTLPNVTAPASIVFPGEAQSNFEQLALREYDLGYNAVRASFAPYCSVQYGLNTQASPQDFMGNYSSAGLGRAIEIAQRLNLWIIVDYHGYADFANSTLVDCWLKFWFGPNMVSGQVGVVGTFTNSYSRIVWEPLNEPAGYTFPLNSTWCSQNLSQCDDNRTAYMSAQYQSWLDIDRSRGDSHWVVLQNLCSWGCYKDRDKYYLDYPMVNDSLTQVFESFHTYLSYGIATTAQDGSTGHGSYWNDTTADIFARQDYLTMVNETLRTGFGWPIFNTEGGTSCGNINGTRCLNASIAVISGAAGYTQVSLRYLQDVINYEDGSSARFGQLFWPAASWTTTTPNSGVYGAIQTGHWGTLINYTRFEASPLVLISKVSPDPASTLQTVTVNFNVTDPARNVASIAIGWGDGTIESVPARNSYASHNYTSTGSSGNYTFMINVTATDDGGLTGYATHTLLVHDLSQGANRPASGLYPTMLYLTAAGLATGIIGTIGAIRLRKRNRGNSRKQKRRGHKPKASGRPRPRSPYTYRPV